MKKLITKSNVMPGYANLTVGSQLENWFLKTSSLVLFEFLIFEGRLSTVFYMTHSVH
jgi:hypothetical protein